MRLQRLRTYPGSRQPERLLREDEQALASAGYRLVATAQRPDAGEDGAFRVIWLPRDAEAATIALFVKAGLAVS